MCVAIIDGGKSRSKTDNITGVTTEKAGGSGGVQCQERHWVQKAGGGLLNCGGLTLGERSFFVVGCPM
jgi:hypothetical protein